MKALKIEENTENFLPRLFFYIKEQKKNLFGEIQNIFNNDSVLLLLLILVNFEQTDSLT